MRVIAVEQFLNECNIYILEKYIYKRQSYMNFLLQFIFSAAGQEQRVHLQ
jgi:hypothetical protein